MMKEVSSPLREAEHRALARLSFIVMRWSGSQNLAGDETVDGAVEHRAAGPIEQRRQTGQRRRDLASGPCEHANLVMCVHDGTPAVGLRLDRVRVPPGEMPVEAS